MKEANATQKETEDLDLEGIIEKGKRKECGIDYFDCEIWVEQEYELEEVIKQTKGNIQILESEKRRLQTEGGVNPKIIKIDNLLKRLKSDLSAFCIKQNKLLEKIGRIQLKAADEASKMGAKIYIEFQTEQDNGTMFKIAHDMLMVSKNAHALMEQKKKTSSLKGGIQGMRTNLGSFFNIILGKKD